MTNEKPPEYTDVRPVQMPDNTTRDVKMTTELWDWKEGMEILENITEVEMSAYALEEQELEEGLEFDRAFRGIVATLARRWEV